MIAVQSHKDKKMIKRKYKHKKIQVIYNWITPKKVQFKKKNKITNFVFAGTIGPAQKWENIINLIIQLNKEKIPLIFIL